MMYNPQLETFLCVADAGSFNKAAATLYITPTAVVKQVNLLESSLGLTLFTRTHRGLVANTLSATAKPRCCGPRAPAAKSGSSASAPRR